MHSIHFEANENKLFEMLQDILRQGLKPQTINDCGIALDILSKVKAVSSEGGEFCGSCGHILRMPQPGQTFNRKLQDGGATLELERGEYQMVIPAFEAFPKNPDALEDFMTLYRKFKP